jgi:uncharacterized membrane protein
MDLEQQRHTRSRLESFSDIVFGVSLATLAMSLPAAGPNTVLHLFDLVLFILVFAQVSTVWWRHHLVFRDYFVVDTPSVVLNFALLAAVALVSYSMQLAIRGDYKAPEVVLYACVFGTMFGALSALITLGMRKRPDLKPELKLAGHRARIGFAAIAIVFFGSLVLLPVNPYAVLLSWLLVPIVRAIAPRIYLRRFAA